jgi:orotate phosphoribosyltransferase
MTKLELAKKVFKISHLTGTFKLRSGLVSNEYFDKYRFESNPEILHEIAKQLASLIPPETEILAALEMGGIPIGTALSIVTGKPIVFVRKKPKDYGTCKFAEGIDIKNKNLCIIEDVITTGGQVVLSAQDLRQDGAIINNVLCVIDRGSESKKKLAEGGQLNLIPLFTQEELKSADKT